MPTSLYLTKIIQKYDKSAGSKRNNHKLTQIYLNRLHDLSRYLVPTAKILDVGSGNGLFVRAAHDAGYEVHAMDKATGCIRRIRQMGIKAYTDLGKIPSHAYDAITLFDVIEHIPQPRMFIRTIETKLKPDGILMITTPNNQGITALITPSYLTAGDGTYSWHVVLYAPVTFTRLLHREFVLLETKTDILLQWYHGKHILWNKVLNKCVYLTLAPFMPLLFSHMRGDNIQIIAKKV